MQMNYRYNPAFEEAARSLHQPGLQQMGRPPMQGAPTPMGGGDLAGNPSGGGALDPRVMEAYQRRSQMAEAYDQELMSNPMPEREEGLFKNIASQGLPALLGAVATIGGAGVPMALAYAMGAGTERTRDNREMNADNRLATAAERYGIARKQHETAIDTFGAPGIGGRGVPAEVQAFNMMAEGLSPEEREKALRIAMGLEGRASSAGFTFGEAKGSDGRTRPVVRNPRDGSIYVVDPFSSSFKPFTGNPNSFRETGRGVGGSYQTQGGPQPAQGSAPQTTPQPAPAPAPQPTPQPQAQPGPGGVNPLLSRSPDEQAYLTEQNKRQAQLDTPLPGDEMILNPDGSLTPRPGSDAEQERIAAAEAEELKRSRERRLGTVIVQDMDRALDLLNEPGRIVDGVPGAVNRLAQSYIPGNPWYDLRSHLDASQATVSLQNLQELKESTGAGLGNVSDKQSALLAAAYGAIDLNQSLPTLKDNLARLRNIYLDIIFGHGRGPERIPLSFQDEWQPLDEGWVDDQGNPIPTFGNTGEAPDPLEGLSSEARAFYEEQEEQ